MLARLLRLLPYGVKIYLAETVFYPLYVKLSLRVRLWRRYPAGVTIELTDRCNLRCSYCPRGKGIGGIGGDMDFNLFTEIVDQANRITKLRQVSLVGLGEPLLYPYLFDAIRYIKENYPYTSISLTTNGLLLNERTGKDLIDSGVDSFAISVNSDSPEKYLQLNGADKYWLVVENTRNFLQTLNKGNKRRNPETYIRILDQVHTIEEIKAFRDYWKPYLYPNAYAIVQPFINWGGIIDQSEVNKGANGYKKINREKEYPCAHLQKSWVITREGNALGCCMVLPAEAGNLVLGNVKEKGLKEIYTEGKIRNLRKLNLEGKLYNEITPCAKCNSWKVPPNVWLRNPLHRRAWF